MVRKRRIGGLTWVPVALALLAAVVVVSAAGPAPPASPGTGSPRQGTPTTMPLRPSPPSPPSGPSTLPSTMPPTSPPSTGGSPPFSPAASRPVVRTPALPAGQAAYFEMPAPQLTRLGRMMRTETPIGRPVPGATRVSVWPAFPLIDLALEEDTAAASVAFVTTSRGGPGMALATVALKAETVVWRGNALLPDGRDATETRLKRALHGTLIEAGSETRVLARYQLAPAEVQVTVAKSGIPQAIVGGPGMRLDDAVAADPWQASPSGTEAIRFYTTDGWTFYLRLDPSAKRLSASWQTTRNDRLASDIQSMESQIREGEASLKSYREQVDSQRRWGTSPSDSYLRYLEGRVDSHTKELERLRNELLKLRSGTPAKMPDLAGLGAKVTLLNGVVLYTVKVKP